MREAHAAVRECLKEMEALTAKRDASPMQFTAARLRISQASLTRRLKLKAICAELGKASAPQALAVSGRLDRLDRDLMLKSTAHVAHWTMERIQSDWAGYCAASHRIRLAMAGELEAEEALLVPLLDPGAAPRAA
jgi:hypothetical protein